MLLFNPFIVKELLATSTWSYNRQCLISAWVPLWYFWRHQFDTEEHSTLERVSQRTTSDIKRPTRPIVKNILLKKLFHQKNKIRDDEPVQNEMTFHSFFTHTHTHIHSFIHSFICTFTFNAIILTIQILFIHSSSPPLRLLRFFLLIIRYSHILFIYKWMMWRY